MFGLIAGFALAPPPQKADAAAVNVNLPGGQTFSVPASASGTAMARDSMTVTPGVETLSLGGTNEDWAKLVLLYGQWPQTEENVTVILRWMRQENGTSSWWNRNNPLNNGYGSGGGSGLGSYDSLAIAAEMCAKNLQTQGSYDAIVASLAASGSADATAAAIWASPWASSHYANGSHWSTSPVDIVKAPDSAW